MLEDTRKYPSQPDCLVPCLKMQLEKETEMTLQLRIPGWLAGEAVILVNDTEAVSYTHLAGTLYGIQYDPACRFPVPLEPGSGLSGLSGKASV